MNHLTPEPDIHDLYAALTRTTTHRERFTAHHGGTEVSKHHITSVPALILQLVEAEPSGSGEMSGSAGKSRPAARIEAIDTLMLIDHEASAWLRKLGHNDPGNTINERGHTNAASGTIACLKKLHAVHASALSCGKPKPKRNDNDDWCCPAHHIEHDTRRWYHQARIITGYDTPAWRPDNTCPNCDERRTLRIKLANQTAMCITCRYVWPPEHIGLLAEFIRWENADTDDEAQADDTESPHTAA